MSDPKIPVGFDYALAMAEIRTKLSFGKISDYLGYESRTSIYRVLDGAIPPHPQGEAIWALYRELFGDKPPVTKEQARGI